MNYKVAFERSYFRHRLLLQPSFIFPLLVFITLILWGYSCNWVQYSQHCESGSCFFHTSETLSSIFTAIYYQIFGKAHWFIQEYPLFGDHPDFFLRPSLFYTHNLNIGAFVIYLGRALGFDTIIFAAVISAVAYSFGIYFAYLYALGATSSRYIAGWFVFFMATDFLYNLSSGLNLIRAWHWLAIFGVAASVIHIIKGSRGFWIPLIITSIIAFFIGYEFTAVTIGVAIVTVITYAVNFKQAAKICAAIVTIFLVIVTFRQLQIIEALGFEIWKHDIIYTFGLKIPTELRWFTIPSENQIADWYKANGLGRGGTLIFSIRDRLNSTVFFSSLSTWYGVKFPAYIIAFSFVANLFWRGWCRIRNKIIVKTGGIRALFSLCLGISIGTVLFFDHTMGYFIRAGFPLISAPIFLALAIATVSLLNIARQLGPRTVIITLTIILCIWIVQQIMNYHASPFEVYPKLISVRPYEFYFE